VKAVASALRVIFGATLIASLCCWPASGLGHEQTLPLHFRMSALPLKADITENRQNVR